LESGNPNSESRNPKEFRNPKSEVLPFVPRTLPLADAVAGFLSVPEAA
jgi:hypothetical protein